MSNLRDKLKNKPYREAYISTAVDTSLAFQIRTLRRQRGWSQEMLGRKIGRKAAQAGVSRLEVPGHGYSLTTLKRLAKAFDVGLMVRFVPFGDLVTAAESLDRDSYRVASFDEEQAAVDAARVPNQQLTNVVPFRSRSTGTAAARPTLNDQTPAEPPTADTAGTAHGVRQH